MSAESAPVPPADPAASLASLLGLQFLLAAVAGVAFVALALGIPTDIIPNPWFVRMTPAGFSNYFFWVASSLLTGVLIATYALPRTTRDRIAATGTGSGLLGLLAVGCPVCNKLVVALLGVSGAFTYFAPIQPVLGALGVMLAAVALAVRLRGARRACAIPVAAERRPLGT